VVVITQGGRYSGGSLIRGVAEGFRLPELLNLDPASVTSYKCILINVLRDNNDNNGDPKKFTHHSPARQGRLGPLRLTLHHAAPSSVAYLLHFQSEPPASALDLHPSRQKLFRKEPHLSYIYHRITGSSLPEAWSRERAICRDPARQSGALQGRREQPSHPAEPVGGTWFPSAFEAESDGFANVDVILHLHGGAFVVGDGRTDYSGFQAGLLTKNLNAKVLSLQYRLASDSSGQFPRRCRIPYRRIRISWVSGYQQAISSYAGTLRAQT